MSSNLIIKPAFNTINIASYSGLKPASSVSVLIVSLGFDPLSRVPISLYRRVRREAPLSIIIFIRNLTNSANRVYTLFKSFT
jgi:hypothetical protein